MKKCILVSTLLLIALSSFYLVSDSENRIYNARLLTYELDLSQHALRFYWKDAQGKNIANFDNLKRLVEAENKELLFAMNGGMYLSDGSPQGLFIESGIQKQSLEKRKEGFGNFYLQPNGVFSITKQQKAVICTSEDFTLDKNIQFATQSGPMLVIDGEIHEKFTKGSSNLHIRNGVGVLPNGKLLFAMSKEKINFYDFASFFRQKGCKNALYLDGFVSRCYLPSKNWEQLDGNFGVIIAETKEKSN